VVVLAKSFGQPQCQPCHKIGEWQAQPLIESAFRPSSMCPISCLISQVEQLALRLALA
jgi:hypothetical protein